jgi:hypothetical protein
MRSKTCKFQFHLAAGEVYSLHLNGTPEQRFGSRNNEHVIYTSDLLRGDGLFAFRNLLTHQGRTFQKICLPDRNGFLAAKQYLPDPGVYFRILLKSTWAGDS